LLAQVRTHMVAQVGAHVVAQVRTHMVVQEMNQGMAQGWPICWPR